VSVLSPRLSSRRAGLILALYLAGPANLPVWREVLGCAEKNTAMVLAAMVCTLFAVFLLLIQTFAFGRLLKVVGSVLLVLASVYWFFMSRFGVLVDEDMIANIFETNVDEAGALMTPRLLLHVLVFGLLPAFLLVRSRLHHDGLRREVARRVLWVLGGVTVAAAVAYPVRQEAAFVVSGHHELKAMVNPLVPLDALSKYLWNTYGPNFPDTLETIAPDASRLMTTTESGRRTLMIFVVGETATAGHFSLNGYERDTNPALEKEPVVNFSNVHACGTSTSTAVPCMFSAMGKGSFSRVKGAGEENLLDVLQRTGIEVLWRENNTGCKGVCDRVPFEDMASSGADAPRNEEGHCFDEVLLSGLQQYVDAQTGDTFVVLHQQGSHGPLYHLQSPEAYKRFLPECKNADLASCDQGDVINAYDNSIVYTDHVLAEVIHFLQANSAEMDTAMLYVSDHGESLGDDGIYLHGLPYWLAPEEQTHVPMVFWGSDGFYEARQMDRLGVAALSSRAYSHDHLFHSLLGLFDIQAAVYDPALDLFADSRSEP